MTRGVAMSNHEEIDIFDILPLPRAYFTITKPKQEISDVFYQAKSEQESSLRKLAEEIKKLYTQDDPNAKTPHYNTLQQITSGGNYTIDNLLMGLDAIGKKIIIVDRTEEDNMIIENRGKIK